ncbi:MAG TPA: glyoxalase superfamily protein, partial [Chitinophagaceae bacterium]
MIFQSTTPILYSSDIERSIKYYTQILGFADSWKWDDPPTFGGVNHNGFNIYFCREGQGHPGTWIAINVDDVDAYHDQILQKGAHIVQPPQSMEWGLREMLVKDPDEHYIRFGQPVSLRNPSDKTLPADVDFIDRVPNNAELKKLMESVGWSAQEEKPPADIPLTSIAYVVLAEDRKSREVVGCAFLLTDNAG